ncbi:MAG: hypothetical protein ACF8XB_17785 [Planctomycetota bacterium JB042]
MSGRSSGLRLAAAVGAVLWTAGCSSAPDPEDVEGIGTTEDGVFRTLELDGVRPDRAFAVARAVVRLHFAGGPMTEDARTRTLELERSSPRQPYRFRFYLRVGESGDGSVVEIYCPIDELREVPSESGEAWRLTEERHARLENDILHAIWNELEVKPLEE